MSTEHTPGPWTIKYVTWAEAAHTFEECLGCADIIIDGPPELDEPEVAFLVGTDKRTPTPNARLIAAAPELLAACRRFARWANTDAGSDEDAKLELLEVDVAIKAAIADATEGSAP